MATKDNVTLITGALVKRKLARKTANTNHEPLPPHIQKMLRDHQRNSMNSAKARAILARPWPITWTAEEIASISEHERAQDELFHAIDRFKALSFIHEGNSDEAIERRTIAVLKMRDDHIRKWGELQTFGSLDDPDDE
jgi:hypothetical protein